MMKQVLIIFIIIILSNISLAQHPQSFMVIHCEPNNSDLFPKLERLVEVADSAQIPLTIMLSPKWADVILENPANIIKIRQWQINGHEIAAHHHGIEAGNTWDGFTNLPPSNWPIPEWYRGNMLDYKELLNQVAGDSLILSACIPAADVDWPQGLIYRTEGHWAADAISTPVQQIVNGSEITLIKHGLITNTIYVDSIIFQYNNNVRPIDVFGVVTHVKNFNDSEDYLRLWFNFIKGKNCMTVRQIIRQREIGTSISNLSINLNLRTGIDLSQNYPNPFIRSTIIPLYLDIPSEVSFDIFNLQGNLIRNIKCGYYGQGYQLIEINGNDLKSGNYILRLSNDISYKGIKITKL